MDRPKIGVALLREGEGALFGKARGLFGRGKQRALWVWRRRASVIADEAIGKAIAGGLTRQRRGGSGEAKGSLGVGS